MADDTKDQTLEADGEESSKGGKAPIFVMLGGLVVGAVAGVFVVGPMFAGEPADKAPARASGGHGDAEPGSIFSHAVQGLIVNPAGDATRLLLASIAIQVDSEETVTELADRDAEVRDVLLSVLSVKSVDELTDTTLRDALKQELLEAVLALHVPGELLRIHIPQFVVQ